MMIQCIVNVAKLLEILKQENKKKEKMLIISNVSKLKLKWKSGLFVIKIEILFMILEMLWYKILLDQTLKKKVLTPTLKLFKVMSVMLQMVFLGIDKTSGLVIVKVDKCNHQSHF